MNHIKYLSLLPLLLCGCITNNPWNGSSTSSGSFSGGKTEGVTQIGSTDLQDFDVAFLHEKLISEPSDVTVLPGDSGDFIEYWDAYRNGEITDIALAWQGDSVAVTGTAKNVAVTVNGTHVTIVSSKKKIRYILSGTCSNGSLKIYSDNKFILTFNALNLTNPNGPVINIQKGKTQEEDGGYPHKTVYVQLSDGTANMLADGSGYATSIQVVDIEEDQKACFFSEGQLIFSGSGALTVTGNNKHAICSDDYIRIRPEVQLSVYAKGEDGIHSNDYVIVGGGLTNIEVSATAGKGIKADSVLIAGGRTTVLTSGSGMYDSTEKDVSACAGVKAGMFTMDGGELYCKSTGSGGKGISVDKDMVVNGGEIQVVTAGSVYQYSRDLDSKPKGIKVDNNLTINEGHLKVRATGAKEGSEGIEAKNVITIHGGVVESYCTDDAINAAKNLTVTGGYVYACSGNNDGIDSNGTISISGGMVVASGTTAPEGGLDCDQNTFSVTGGYVIGIGGENSSPSASSTTQACLICGGSCNQGAVIAITDADGNLVMSYVSDRTYTQMSMLTSTPDYAKGNTYSLISGGTVSGGVSFHGLNCTGLLSNGTTVLTTTLSSMVTTVGNTGGMGGGGNPGGGGPGGNPGGGGPGGGFGW